MTHEEELLVIRRVLDGDPNAFEQLVIANQKNVYNLALKMTSSEQDALDISQEAFLKAYSRLPTFRHDSRFSVWIYRITYNLCIDLARKNRTSNIVSLSASDDDGGEAPYQIPDDTLRPDTIFDKNELFRAVADAIDVLPSERRQIILLRESGMSYAEIARTLNISEGAVKSRLSRARRQVLKKLIENGTFSEKSRHNNREEGGKS